MSSPMISLNGDPLLSHSSAALRALFDYCTDFSLGPVLKNIVRNHKLEQLGSIRLESRAIAMSFGFET